MEDFEITEEPFSIQDLYHTNPLKDTTELEKSLAYRDYLKIYLKPFFIMLNTLNDAITCFVDAGILHEEYTTFNARIKDQSSIQKSSAESWLKYSNMPNPYKEKAIDDIFGLEVQTQGEFQKEIMSIFFKLIIKPIKEKYHDKKNGYKAFHTLGFLAEPNILKDNINYYLENYPQYCSEIIKNIDLSFIKDIEEVDNLKSQIVQELESIETIQGNVNDISKKIITLISIVNDLSEQGQIESKSSGKMAFMAEISPIALPPYKFKFLENIRIAPTVSKQMIENSDLPENIKKDLITNFIDEIVALQAQYKKKQDSSKKKQDSLEVQEILGAMQSLQEDFMQEIVSKRYVDNITLDSSITAAFKSAIGKLNEMRKNYPDLPFEFPAETQVKTKEVAYNAIYGNKEQMSKKDNTSEGNLAHSEYKGIDELSILRKLHDQRLLPGINSPLKFYRDTSGKIRFKDFFTTVEENYSFTQEFLKIYKAARFDTSESKKNERARAEDFFKTYEEKIGLSLSLVGIEFEELRPYINTKYNFVSGDQFKSENPNLIWEYITSILLRQDFIMTQKPEDATKMLELITGIRKEINVPARIDQGSGNGENSAPGGRNE